MVDYLVTEDEDLRAPNVVKALEVARIKGDICLCTKPVADWRQLAQFCKKHGIEFVNARPSIASRADAD